MQEIAELISLGMTFPTVVLAIAVVYVWFPSARNAVLKSNKEAHDWFIVGVVVGFVGSLLDNIYWFMPWTASFLGHPAFETLTNAGVFFNVFFRQGCGIIAAYCHIKAAEWSENTSSRFVNRLLASSYLIGFAYSTVLILSQA